MSQPEAPLHFHLIGVCGTGMGALAGLLKLAGHRVTGSDRAFYPPMGPALERWGIETMRGFNAENVSVGADKVVVGNVCRPTNEEARAFIDSGVPHASMPEVIQESILAGTKPLVVAGTHGKTTTASLTAHLLQSTGAKPGYLLGGIPLGFERSHALGTEGGPFVIEGDEYDCAFFEKRPKFWRYDPHVAIVTSIEHDHVDIYPDEASYVAAFEGLVSCMDPNGVLVLWAGDARVRELAKAAKCRVVFYAIEGDDIGDASPIWYGAAASAQGGAQPIDLFIGGTFGRRVHSPMLGLHNARNLMGAIAACAEGYGVDVASLVSAAQRFRGVKRRQELLGVISGVHVYEDFAHHPTAVRETLRALRRRHPDGRLLAAFEPRSATASRRTHQELYAEAFAPASLSVIAPVGRKEIPDSEKLDLAAIIEEIQSSGGEATNPPNLDEVVHTLVERAEPGDTIALMSNGSFGGIYDKVLLGLTAKAAHR